MLEKKRAASVDNDLWISVPSLFRCPISLDVMKSPVSLSTGVTYERSSIQKWLDGGHNTCPATMQVLSSKDFVPNHTLHRLIQIWSDSAKGMLGDESAASREQAREVIVEMRRDSSARTVKNLEKIAWFGADSDDNRRYLVRLNGFDSLMVDLIRNVDDEVAEQALKITAAVVSTDESSDLKELLLKRDCVNSLLRFLSKGSSSNAKIAAVQVIEIIARDSESKLVLADKEELLPQLLKLVDHWTDSSLMEAVLNCLISLSMAKRVKLKLVRLGIVATLAKLLTTTTSNISVISTERMLKLLETVSSCKEGRREICDDRTCIPAILAKTMKVSRVATEHAVTILWSVCCLFRDEKAQEAVAMNNGLTKVLLVMQSNCQAGVRQMAVDLLKLFRVNSKSLLCSYDTKTTHIMPF
ncbi:unnamed protein product [Rhodiola kirilowii]